MPSPVHSTTPTSPRLRRRGFTLLELLVSIALIAVLVSLLLPAVQSAREAARRTQCQSQARQVALAVLGYEGAHGRLPSSGVVGETVSMYANREYRVFDQRSGPMIGWTVLVLPQLEEQSLADRFDLGASVLEQPGDPQEALPPVLVCPSDNPGGRYYADDEFTAGKRFAKGNYAAYTSPFHLDLQLMYPGALVQGGQPMARVVDGASRTLLVAEVRTLDDPRDERGAWALPWNAASLLAMDAHHSTGQGAGYFSQFEVNPSLLYQSQTPNHRGPNADVLVRCDDELLPRAQLEGMPCLKHTWRLGFAGYLSAAPRSMHPGGVNGTMLDGHVVYLTDDIDPGVMALMVGIRDARNTVEAPAESQAGG